MCVVSKVSEFLPPGDAILAFFLLVVHELNPSEEDRDLLSEERVNGVEAAGVASVISEEGRHLCDDPADSVCHLIVYAGDEEGLLIQ